MKYSRQRNRRHRFFFIFSACFFSLGKTFFEFTSCFFFPGENLGGFLHGFQQVGDQQALEESQTGRDDNNYSFPERARNQTGAIREICRSVQRKICQNVPDSRIFWNPVAVKRAGILRAPEKVVRLRLAFVPGIVFCSFFGKTGISRCDRHGNGNPDHRSIFPAGLRYE